MGWKRDTFSCTPMVQFSRGKSEIKSTYEVENTHLQLHPRGTGFESEKKKPGQYIRWKRDTYSFTAVVCVLRAKKRNQVNIWDWKEILAAAPLWYAFREQKKAKSGQHMGWKRDTCSCNPYGTIFKGKKSKEKRDLQLLPLRIVSEPDYSYLIFTPGRLLLAPATAPPVVWFLKAKKQNQVIIVEKRHLQLHLLWYGFWGLKTKSGKNMRWEWDTCSCCLYDTFVSKPDLSNLISLPNQPAATPRYNFHKQISQS